LRDRIRRELRAQLGRTASELKLFQDTVAIPYGTQWEKEIKEGIGESVFFIPIITPTAVNSRHCKTEFELFCSRELQLGRADLIFPILYIRVAALENDAKRRQNDVLEIIHARQYADWTQLRLRDVASFEFGIKIEQFCRDVCDALHEPWLSPEERRQAEEEQRRKAAEAEAKRFEEERRRQAEEEQRRKGAEAEAKRFEEERRRQAEEEQRRKAEAEAKQLEEERRRQAEEERRRRVAEVEAKRLEEERRRQAEEERRRRVAEVEAKRLEEERRRQAATLPKRLQEIKTSLNDFVHFITPFLFVLLGVSFLFSIILFVREQYVSRDVVASVVFIFGLIIVGLYYLKRSFR
jgi:hypothetical protein